MRAVRLAVVVALAEPDRAAVVVASTTAGASAQSSTQVSAPAAVGDRAATTKRKGNKWAPPTGALLSDPLDSRARPQHPRRVITATYNTAKGEYIRVVVWNYDDARVTNALLDADGAGCTCRWWSRASWRTATGPGPATSSTARTTTRASP